MAWFDQRFIVVLRPFPCNSTAIRSIDAPSCDSIRFEANDFLLSWKKKTHENGTKQFESIKKKHSMKRASTRSSPTLISSMRPIGKHFWRSRSDDVITRSTHFHPLSTPFPPTSSHFHGNFDVEQRRRLTESATPLNIETRLHFLEWIIFFLKIE